jgi:hypothetical protein
MPDSALANVIKPGTLFPLRVCDAIVVRNKGPDSPGTGHFSGPENKMLFSRNGKRYIQQ